MKIKLRMCENANIDSLATMQLPYQVWRQAMISYLTLCSVSIQNSQKKATLVTLYLIGMCVDIFTERQTTRLYVQSLLNCDL